MLRHFPRLIVLPALLCGMMVMLILVLASSPGDSHTTTTSAINGASEALLPVGVILAGDAGAYGWDGVTSSGAEFDNTTVNDHPVILYDNLAQTDITLASVVEQMITRGARIIFVSAEHQADGVPVAEQYPDIVFVMNLAARADVERLLASLPPGVSVSDLRVLQAEKTTASSPREGSRESASPGVALLIVVLLIGVMTLVGFRRMFLVTTAALPSRSVVGRLIDAMQEIDFDKPKKKRATSGPHGRALALQRALEDRKTDFAAQGEPPPLLHRLSAYVHGATRYDEAFALELASDKFLGKCGIETIMPVNRYDTMSTTAFEVWLFDLQDARTVAGVLASLYAANDPARCSKLERRGQVVQAQPEAVITLETSTLRLRVRVLDAQYGFSDTLPPSSAFDYLVVEIAGWQKT